jgi:hypothetical protein
MRLLLLSVFTTVFLFSIVLFAQAVTANATNATATGFVPYCLDKCVPAIGQDKCDAVCSGSGEPFQNVCAYICVEKGTSKDLCKFVCALAEKKRDSIKECFDPCSKTNSTVTCEAKCDIYTLFSQLNIAVAKGGIQNLTSISAQKIARIAEIAGISPEAVAETALRKNITIRAGKINLTTVDGRKVVKIPVNLTEGELLTKLEDRLNGIKIENGTIELPVKSAIGQRIAKIVMETGGILGKEGSGEATVSKIMLKSEEVRADLKAAVKEELKARLKETKVTIDADLNDIPENLTLDIKSSDVPERKLQRFKEIARQANFEIKEKAVAIEVDKGNLKNIEDVTRAKIRIKVDKEWVSSIGGASKVKIVREDSENYEMLNTTVVGEENGLIVFEGDSPNGLSLYALVTVEPLSPTQTTTGGQQKLPVDLVIGGAVVILIIVAGAIYFFGKK